MDIRTVERERIPRFRGLLVVVTNTGGIYRVFVVSTVLSVIKGKGKCFGFEYLKKHSKGLQLQNLVLLEFRPVRCVRFASVRVSIC